MNENNEASPATTPALRPPDFEARSGNPFEHDRLGRRSRVEALCQLVAEVPGPAVIAVNGGYGTGKSAFLKMCAAQLRQQQIRVVEFDAWRQGHTGSPLVDLTSALGPVDARTARRLQKIAANLSWRVASAATRGILDPQAFAGIKRTLRSKAWDRAERQTSEFRQALSSLAQRDGGRLAVLIDELDRCLPDYAMQTLNTALHLFDVPGIVVVMGINRAELDGRVRKVYGQQCDAEIYLRRFVDLSIELDDPDREQLAAFFGESVRASGLELAPSSIFLDALQLLAARTGASLRDIQQTVHYAAQILPTPERDREGAARLYIVAMMMLRVVHSGAYNELKSGKCDPFTAVSRLREGLGAGVEAGDKVTMHYIEAILLSLAGPDGYWVAKRYEDFVQRYAEAELGDEANAQDVFKYREVIHGRVYGSAPTASGLAARIELA